MARRLTPRWVRSRGALPALLLGVAATALGPLPLRAQQPDTARTDTVLTVRERALARLRALPTTPIQPDTAAADTLAVDTVGADTLAPPGARPTAVRPSPVDTLAGDTVVVFPAGNAEPRTAVVPADSVLGALAALPGYVTTEYTGEAAVFQADSNRLRLTGKSNVAREGSSLSTDSVLVYAGDTGIVCGYGKPVLQGEGEAEPVESNRVCYDINRDIGMASGATTKFEQGATWYVRGAENRVYVLTGGPEKELYGRKAEFTSCDLPQPHYVFEARSLKMVQDQVMVARNVTLKFEDVPVFWLPWMVQSMKRDRKSGLLVPQFGVNDIVRNGQGYNRHISNLGFYWAINDYLSAQTTFDWFASNYTALQAGVSYKVLRQFLDGNLQGKEFWRQGETGGGGREFTLHTNNSWQPDERTNVTVAGDYASSTQFVRQNSFDPTELNRQIKLNAGVRRSFSWGSSSLGYQNAKDLNTEKQTTTLPSFSVSVNPKTLYSNADGTLSLSWNGSASATRQLVDVLEATLPGRNIRDQETVSARANQSFSFGNLSVSQSIDYQDASVGVKPPVFTETDTLGNPSDTLPAFSSQRLQWQSSIGYQQKLWTGTQITPSLSLSGEQVRDTLTAAGFVSRPMQISTGATLRTDLYGFWPGFAGFSRIRHKISPSLTWQYRPALNSTQQQDSVFGVSNLREANTLTLSFNQTFEAKVAESDTMAADTAAADSTGAAGEPRRLPSASKVMLLALNTSGPFTYDFVAAREGRPAFVTDQVTNSLHSDLLKNLTVSFTHDLFEGGETLTDGTTATRHFSPFLTAMNASFSIDDNFWLFRFLGLAGGSAAVQEKGEEEPVEEESPAAEDLGGSVGAIMPGGTSGRAGFQGGGPVGGWRAQLNYSLSRTRPSLLGFSQESQNAPGERVVPAHRALERELAHQLLVHRPRLRRPHPHTDPRPPPLAGELRLHQGAERQLLHDLPRPAPGQPGPEGGLQPAHRRHPADTAIAPAAESDVLAAGHGHGKAPRPGPGDWPGQGPVPYLRPPWTHSNCREAVSASRTSSEWRAKTRSRSVCRKTLARPSGRPGVWWSGRWRRTGWSMA